MGGEQLVVGRRSLFGQDRFTGGEQVGSGEQLAYLVEHEGIEFVGSDAPFGAATVRATGTPRIAMRAEVVAGCCLASMSPMADESPPQRRDRDVVVTRGYEDPATGGGDPGP